MKKNKKILLLFISIILSSFILILVSGSGGSYVCKYDYVAAGQECGELGAHCEGNADCCGDTICKFNMCVAKPGTSCRNSDQCNGVCGDSLIACESGACCGRHYYPCNPEYNDNDIDRNNPNCCKAFHCHETGPGKGFCEGDHVAVCGDGNVDSGEECDLESSNGEVCVPGYGGSCDYCSEVCEIETLEGPYCGDGVKNVPYEECDGEDGVGIHQICSQECELIDLLYCGDGIVNNGETCELPNTNNNKFCSQSTSKCSGAKLGVRDAYGNCNSACGCKYDSFIYSCVAGKCGAECALNSDCDDENPHTLDTCNTQSCGCEHTVLPYCGDGNVDPGEECDDGINNGIECTPEYGGSCNYCSEICEIETIEGPYCGDGIINGEEECDDGNNDDGDGCSSECLIEEPEPYCGDGLVNNGETCELPNTNNNKFCSQSTSKCSGAKLGVRDAYGNCNSACGCIKDPFVYSCVVGECGAECALNSDCDDSVCSETYHDYCYGKKLVEYNSNKIIDSTTISDFAENTCNLNGCSCSDNPVDCSPPPLNIYCVAGKCGAECALNSDCDDQNPNTLDTCNIGTCGCEHTVLPYCGDGIINGEEECDLGPSNGIECTPEYGGSCNYCSEICEIETIEGPYCGDEVVQLSYETCELPNTNNNNFCSQTTSICSGAKLGVRDGYGNCDSVCGCIKDPFVYSCVVGECGAECALNSDCDDEDPHTLDTCNTQSCGCEHITLPYCGDGNVDPGEECDDGNNDDGDGCSSGCLIEEPECYINLDCGIDYCIGDPNYCYLGDVYQDFLIHECINPGEPDAYCSEEIMPKLIEECEYGCENGFCISGPSDPVCGNDILETGEECDLGLSNGEVCVPEYGGNCSYCTISCEIETIEGGYCGDDVKDVPYEECDGEDGVGIHQTCSQECELIDLLYCGDGNVDPGEECDDGNNDDGDGCSSECLIEESGPVCGNDILETGEECDWGLLNGIECDNSEHNCNYCSLSCEIIYLKGPGNGNGDGDDFIDLGCGNWSVCTGGIQTRVCYEIFGSSYYSEFIEEKSCISDFVPLGQGTNGTITLGTSPSSSSEPVISSSSVDEGLGIGGVILIIILALLVFAGIIFIVTIIKRG